MKHPKYDKADALTPEVIGAAIEVHRLKGPGLVESIYEKCLMRELQLRGTEAAQQFRASVEYKGYTFKEDLRLDLYVEGCLIVELKAVKQLLPEHEAQLLSYMKLLDAPVGLLINFHEALLKNGIKRMILPGAPGTDHA